MSHGRVSIHVNTINWWNICWSRHVLQDSVQKFLNTFVSISLPTVVISDGRLLRRSMERLGLDDGWLQARLRDARVRSPREVFLLSVDEAGSVVCLPKEGKA